MVSDSPYGRYKTRVILLHMMVIKIGGILSKANDPTISKNLKATSLELLNITRNLSATLVKDRILEIPV